MCGIVGQLGGTPDCDVLTAMGQAIVARGPDSAGVLVDGPIGLAHRRLAIVDLSESGSQPMRSTSGRLTIIFNGEIYNHKALRAMLVEAGKAPEGGWRGTSDTEVLLAAIESWGVEAALLRCVGMFALALWDKVARRLTLARDRFGEKPLYYAFAGRSLLFASELGALERHPSFGRELNGKAVDALLRRNYIPAPLSIYKDCWKLLPGSALVLDLAELPEMRGKLADPSTHGEKGSPVQRYWCLQNETAEGLSEAFRNEDEALEALDLQFAVTLAEQNDADVPVGAFLSGGVDSSAVVALLQHHTNTTAQTFTIGFDEKEYDESRHARDVARFLGTRHQEVIVSPQEAIDVIQKMPETYSEPFADSSQIPTFLVSQLARQHVTVSLSGDGGDELFGGYNRHVWAQEHWPAIARLPHGLRHWAGKAIAHVPAAAWSAVRTAGRLAKVPQADLKAQKIGRILSSATHTGEVYTALLEEFPGINTETQAQGDRLTLLPALLPQVQDLPLPRQMMLFDALTYLPGDILCKVDRAAMAHSLETRVPLLDHRIARISMRMPMHMLIRNGTSKWALRKLLYRHVPGKLIDRPKAGFGIPVGHWLRGPLRDWAQSLLAPDALRDTPGLDATKVHLIWQEHLAGKRDLTGPLWAILMLQASLVRQRG